MLRISGAGFVLSLTIIFFAVVNVAWFARHTVPPTWDESNYLETSELLYQAVRAHHPRAFWNAYVGAVFGSKAPLLAVLTIPAYLLLGSGRAGVDVTLVLLTVAFCWICYNMCVALTGNRWLSVVAVITTGTMPIVYGLNRWFLVDYGLAILVIAWVWLQARSDNFLLLKYDLALGIVFGLGTLMKVSFAGFVIVPVLWGILNHLRQQGFNAGTLKRLTVASVLILVPGALILGTWYLPGSNYKTALGHAMAAANSVDYASAGAGTLSELLDYAREVVVSAISVYYGALLGALAIVRIASHLHSKKRVSEVTRPQTLRGAATLLFVWPAITLGLSSMAVVKDIRYVLPVFPAIGAGIAWLLFTVFRTCRGRAIGVPAILLAPVAIFLLNSLPLGDHVVYGNPRWRVFGRDVGYAQRPRSEQWPDEAIVRMIAKDAERYFRDEGQIFVVAASDTASFNQHTFRYYATHLGLTQKMTWSAILTSKGLTPERWREILEWTLQAKYIVAKTGEQGPQFSTYRSDEIREILDRGELPYTRWAVFDLPDGSEGVVYRQRRPTSTVDLTNVITRESTVLSWEANTYGPDQLKLKVWRKHGGGFVVVDESPQTVAQMGRNVFTLSKPLVVWPGDYLGIYFANGNVSLKSAASATSLVRPQYELEGDVLCGSDHATWIQTRPYSVSVHLDGKEIPHTQNGPTQTSGRKTAFGGKPLPLTFLDMSKRIAETGNLVSWVVNAAAPEDMRLKIWRKVQEGWTVAAESPVVVPTVGFNRFVLDPPLKVEAGDYLGFYTDWHGPDAKGVAVPFPVREGGCQTDVNGSAYVPGDFEGTVGVKMTQDKASFQFYAFQEVD